MMERLLYKPAEVGELIGVSRARAYELIAAGVIPSIRIGTVVERYVRGSIREFERAHAKRTDREKNRQEYALVSPRCRRSQRTGGA